MVVIGGLAVILHGGDHNTKDADFVVVRRRENARIVASVLAPYHPKPIDWPTDLPFIWDEEAIMRSTVLTLDTDLCRVDLLAEPDGAPAYPQLKASAIPVDMDGRTVFVASIDDLISMKRAAGRPKDMAHIAELETLKRLIADEDA